MPKASVIIAFYNKIDYLKLVLAGFERQSETDFEVIIADDGSREEVVKEVVALQRLMPFVIQHIWHEDQGWRKNKMLNKAVQAAKSDYLIFIDGDCIPHKHFVKEHVQSAKYGICQTGRRVNLSEKITVMLTPKKVKDGFLEKKLPLLILDGLFGKSTDIEKGVYLEAKWSRNQINQKKRGLLGCNFSLYREDLLRINGFDERYVAPAVGEDTDVQFRLEKIGISIKSLNNIAIQYHLYHRQLERTEQNKALFQEVVKQGIAFTPYGIMKSNN